MLPEQSPRTDVPYWNLDWPLGIVPIGDELQPVRLKAHLSHERFTDLEPAINPLGIRSGERDALFGHLFFLEPTTAGTPFRHVIGHAAAWYYPAARTIVLWELDVFDRFATAEPHRHAFLPTLWQGFERHLLAHFPNAQTILTPSWEPSVPTWEWHQFLASLGYRPHATDERAYIKTR
jgi:hypothetical protein